MRFLLVQPTFPGQWHHLLRTLVGEGGHDIVYLYDSALTQGAAIPGVATRAYPAPARVDAGPVAARDFTNAVARGEAVLGAARDLRDRGFVPDVIWAHGGFGEGVFVKQAFPESRLLVFAEYYHGVPGTEIDYDPAFQPTDQQRKTAKAKNATLLTALGEADAVVAPTAWQASLLPAPWRAQVRVIHDGIDTDTIAPRDVGAVRLPDGTVLKADQPVVTFAARALEPIRGIHWFLRALPQVFSSHPNAQVVVAGVDRSAYGPQRTGGLIRQLRQEIGDRVPWDRVHFPGWLRSAQLHALFSVTHAHVYPSAPFVQSWSLIEAMACGAPIVASDTAAVRDLLVDRESARLTDPRGPARLGRVVADVIAAPQTARRLSSAARARAVAVFDARRVCVPRQRALLAELHRSSARAKG